jgi:hypothetical protein
MTPWDGCEVKLVRSDDQLPATTDGGEHLITGIHVCDVCDDPCDPRFVIGFQTATGRTLRVRLPAEQLTELARVLFYSPWRMSAAGFRGAPMKTKHRATGNPHYYGALHVFQKMNTRSAQYYEKNLKPATRQHLSEMARPEQN